MSPSQSLYVAAGFKDEADTVLKRGWKMPCGRAGSAPDPLLEQDQDQMLLWERCGCTHGLGMILHIWGLRVSWDRAPVLGTKRWAPPASPFAPRSLWLFKTQTCSVLFHVGAGRNPCAFGFLFPSVL